MTDSKICLSCREKNNPSFTHCWKCGAGLDGNQAVQQTPIQEKKVIPFYWFLIGAFGIQSLLAFYRDFVTTQRYAGFGEIVSGIIPAMFALTMMALINGGIFYGIYWVIMKFSKKRGLILVLKGVLMKLDKNQWKVIWIVLILLIPIVYVGNEEIRNLNNEAVSERIVEQLKPQTHFFDDFIKYPLERQRDRLMEIVTMLTMFVVGAGFFTLISMEAKKTQINKKRKVWLQVFGLILYSLLCVLGYKIWMFSF